MENLGSIIFVVIAAIAGYLFGLLDGRVTNSIQKNTEERKDANALPPPVSAPAPVEVEKPALSIFADDPQTVRVKLHGVFIHPHNIMVEDRAKMVSLIMRIRPWLDAKAPPPAAPAPVSVSPAIASPVAGPPRLTPAVANSTPKLDPLRGARSFLENSVMPKKAEEPTLASPVTLINQHLQAKIAGTPLEKLQISLKDGPFGEVHVAIGTHTYTSIEAVPDPQIQAIIRAAIADWNRSG